MVWLNFESPKFNTAIIDENSFARLNANGLGVKTDMGTRAMALFVQVDFRTSGVNAVDEAQLWTLDIHQYGDLGRLLACRSD
jgi:hypothetical protein